jgi:Fe2+ or Zn2+ uptake regulation protein
MAQRSTPRLPDNYRLLLDLVEAAGAGTHRSTADLYDLARDRRPGIGYSTVQRGLQRLAELDLIMPVRVPGVEAVLYEPRGRRHAHFACDICGKAYDVDYAVPRATLERLAERYGFAVSGESVAFRGVCRSCTQ